ncbi:Arc family DNA-binding protein [Delftia lacustris]|uniref:Arc family DNA-binding protein n=1 Tax=Delftia lacustris TaxID=558537 RepID=UPI0006406467|nr:Arc family DNA-binding protein [Delftia lacustris]
MARDDPTIYMRIPQELKDLLDAASEENRRSMTAEVVARLQQTFAVPRVSGMNSDSSQMNLDTRVGDETLETVKRIEERLQSLAQALALPQRGPQPDTDAATPEKSTGKRVSKSAQSAAPKK